MVLDRDTIERVLLKIAGVLALLLITEFFPGGLAGRYASASGGASPSWVSPAPDAPPGTPARTAGPRLKSGLRPLL